MTIEATDTIEPITASADGKRNMYTLKCVPLEQSMNYAACLWRQGVLSVSNIKTPADWAPCGTACRAGTCTALNMRQEEVLAGKAIYFQDRNVFRKVIDAAKQWIMPSFGTTTPTPKPSIHMPKKDMLDAIGSAGSFADAISVAAKTSASVPVARVIPVVVAQTGESPLQMARRMAAARSTTI